MPSSAKNHDVLILGGAAGAAFVGFKLYQKYQADKLAAAAAAGAGNPYGLLPYTPGPTAMVSSPIVTGGGQTQGSITDPRTSPGGLVGQVMWRKNWTQQQAQARLDALQGAYKTAAGAINSLRSQTVNPAAANISEAQAALNLNVQALQNAQSRQAADAAAGDALGAARWASAAAGHQQNVTELRARISAASAPPDNSAAIATYEGAIAGYKADWLALTGQPLA